MRLRAQGKIMSPQIKELSPGRPVMRFALVEMDREGKQTWHSCAAWGGMAAKMSRLCEGDMVEVVARSATKSFTGVTGTRRTVTEYIVETYTLLKSSKHEEARS